MSENVFDVQKTDRQNIGDISAIQKNILKNRMRGSFSPPP